MLVDTHCHIHDREFYTAETAEEVYTRACVADVMMLCIGTSQSDSKSAIQFASEHDKTWAVVGVHPHEAKDGVRVIGEILTRNANDGSSLSKIVGIGEIGLDYYYDHSPRDIQIAALEQQLQWAIDYNLPVSFHVRDASSVEQRTSVWKDFWPILDNFPGVRGTLHSFTDSQANLDKGFEHGLYVSVNGISTFTKDPAQQQLFATIPLEKLLLETDAPFLTPKPYRGTINEPAFVSEVAKHHAAIRGIGPDTVAMATTANAISLFSLQ